MFLLTCGSRRIFAANLFYGKSFGGEAFGRLICEASGRIGGEFRRQTRRIFAAKQRTHCKVREFVTNPRIGAAAPGELSHIFFCLGGRSARPLSLRRRTAPAFPRSPHARPALTEITDKVCKKAL